MCGLAGILDSRGLAAEPTNVRLRAMTDPIQHRGPDDSGTWVEEVSGLALGFRRLSILDLSPTGHQPMASASGRFVLVFNGEVYNYLELRRELESLGAGFRGSSDTEVVLAAFEAWGVREGVKRFVGMFAMAIWDREKRSLTLLRDRLGLKPLYYSSSRGVILFGSELKAIRRDPAFDSALDTQALSLYLRFLFVPAPYSIFRSTRKIPPGHLLEIRDSREPVPETEPYWSLADIAREGLNNPERISDEEAVDRVEEALSESVRIRLRADVPVGALLSGGVDSSTVVALAQSLSSRPIRTFSIGFDVPEHDESADARRVAEHLGTTHTDMMVTGEDGLGAIPRIAEIFDEPLADPSEIPTLLVSELARRQVVVALSGDGGDELFGGYNRHIHGSRWIGRLARIPVPLRGIGAAGLNSIDESTWDRLSEGFARRRGSRLVGEKLHKLARMMSCGTEWEMYRTLLGPTAVDPQALLTSEVRVDDPVEGTFRTLHEHELRARMLFTDQATYLPDDLLAKVDRASMSSSLEVRVPILDHRIVELSWQLPWRHKIRGTDGKWILKRILARHVPEALTARPKVGFTAPIGSWLRGSLRSWADDLLSEDRLSRQGIFDADSVGRLWSEFTSERSEQALGLWALLQFQSWVDVYS